MCNIFLNEKSLKTNIESRIGTVKMYIVGLNQFSTWQNS